MLVRIVPHAKHVLLRPIQPLESVQGQAPAVLAESRTNVDLRSQGTATCYCTRGDSTVGMNSLEAAYLASVAAVVSQQLPEPWPESDQSGISST